MSAFEIVAIFVAGIAAGTINTVVGSGTLITFPMLLAFHYAPVTANVSNTIGLVPGSVSGAVGYRQELSGQRQRAVPLLCCSILGGAIGAVLLLTLPASAFKAIVPFFIGLALFLIVFQKHIQALLGDRGRRDGGLNPVAAVGSFVAGIYGGYFGAAQGILLMAIYGLTIKDELQRLNAIKIVSAGAVNLVSGVVFIFAAHVAWGPAALIAAGSVLGGVIGGRYGRRLPPNALRALIIVVGVIAIVRLV